MSASVQKSFLPQQSDLAAQQEAQRLNALNPTQSVWVSASAGSGKTTLLTERVLRLLLQNRIEKRYKLPNILCLTYTKAEHILHNRLFVQHHTVNTGNRDVAFFQRTNDRREQMAAGLQQNDDVVRFYGARRSITAF